MTDKSRRNLTRCRGRGFRKKNGAGSRGGTGNAGLSTHKRFSKILLLKKQEASRKITCIRDIESKMDSLIKKKIVTRFCKVNKLNLGTDVYYRFSDKFAESYKKILSQGEPSGIYLLPRAIKVSKNTKLKIK